MEASALIPKKAKSIASAGKVMASVFWDTKGILLIDYLEKLNVYDDRLKTSGLNETQGCYSE